MEDLVFPWNRYPDKPTTPGGFVIRLPGCAESRKNKIRGLLRRDLETQGGEVGGLGRHGELEAVGILRGFCTCRSSDKTVFGHRERGRAALGRSRLDRCPGGLQTQMLHPRPLLGDERVGRGSESLLQTRDFFTPVEFVFLLLIRPQLKDGTFVLEISVLALVEKGENLEVLGVGEWVELVGVALGTGHRRAHPGGKGRVDTIDDRFVAELFVVRAALTVRHRVAVKGGRDELIPRRLLEEISGDLLNRELVKRHVLIEGAQHVVTIGPDRARRIIGIPGRVRVARKVEPDTGPALSIGGLGKEPVKVGLVGVRGGIIDKGDDFFPRRRQSGEVE